MSGSSGSSGPSLAEVRAKGQPPEVLARLNDEHWFGRLYMRRLSPYATIAFARLGWSPNAVTVCFMISGAAAGSPGTAVSTPAAAPEIMKQTVTAFGDQPSLANAMVA